MVSMKTDTTSSATVNQSEVFFLFANCPVGSGGEEKEKELFIAIMAEQIQNDERFSFVNLFCR